MEMGADAVHATRIGCVLRDWRKASGVKQDSLAAMLGVSQSAVSSWETGRDEPGRRVTGRLIDIMSPTGRDRLQLDNLALSTQGAVRASFDLDGVKLIMASRGLTAAWPDFAKLTHSRLIERLVDEASLMLHDDDFVRSVRRGEVALVAGVSDRHVDLEMDKPFRHRWVAVFRTYGQKMFIDMTYEGCEASLSRCVEGITHYDSLGS
jgi:transcriptional regulator with XRE-family HTH domain